MQLNTKRMYSKSNCVQIQIPIQSGRTINKVFVDVDTNPNSWDIVLY